MLDSLARNWWAVASQGAAMLIFGLLALFYPHTGADTLMYFFGAFALIEGALGVLAGYDFRGGLQPTASVSWLTAMGTVSLLAGVLAFAWPSPSLVPLYALISSWAVVTGCIRIASAFRGHIHRKESALVLLAGAQTLVWGMVVAFQPGVGLLAAAMLHGAFAVAIGVTLCSLGGILVETNRRRVTITMAKEPLPTRDRVEH